MKTLFGDSRVALAAARAAGSDTVTVLLASAAGKADDLAAFVAERGGSVVRRHDPIGYLRAAVPLEVVDELLGHDAVDTLGVLALHDFVPATNMSQATELSPGTAGAALPDPFADAYSPLGDLAADTFRAEHSTWDGRGVTVAIIDGLLDQLLPEFQEALTIDGRPVRKVIGCINPIDPAVDGGPEWVTAWQEVTAVAGRIDADGRELTAPRDGVFHLGWLDRSRLLIGGPGFVEADEPLVGVLWDRASGEVWVDTDQDLSFAGLEPLKDFATEPGFGIFGDDLTFTIQVRADREAVAINLGVWGHAVGVMGGTFGSRGASGRYDGIAPGAQIVAITPRSADFRSTAATFVEGLIAAFTHPAVDLVVYEQGTTSMGSYLLKDGRSIVSVLLQRLVEAHGKPVFVPASNAPWTNQIDEESVGTGVIGVGGYQSQECYLVNDGRLVADRDNLHRASSHGPAGDGGMSPLLLAPTNLLSSWPAFDRIPPVGPQILERGYSIAGGTSTAAPSAAAAAALLISAAKQSGVRYDPARLRQALCASARFLPGIAAHKQGNGLIQVESAWRVLCDLEDDVEVTASAPVSTTISEWLTPPHRGRGLYEHEGWSVGDRSTRTITLTREGGSAEPVDYGVRLLGDDDGTFAVAGTVTLPRGEPVPLELEIAPRSPGVHSVVVELLELSRPAQRHAVLATIVVPAHAASPVAECRGESREGSPAAGATHFTLAAGAMALHVETAMVPMSPVVTPPHGGFRDRGEVPEMWSTESRTGTAWSLPPAGVWEVAFMPPASWRSLQPQAVDTPVRRESMTVTALGVDVEPQLSPEGIAVTLTNRHGGFVGGLSSRSLAAARTLTTTTSGVQTYEIEVAPGTELLLAAFDTEEPEAVFNLYLFDCTGSAPTLVKKKTLLNSRGLLSVESPESGTWKVVVDAKRAGTTYHYLDAVLHPDFGSVRTSEPPRQHFPEEKWKQQLEVSPVGRVPAGRVPTALLLVTSPDVKQQVGRTQADPRQWAGLSTPTQRDPEEVPLGWAAVLLGPDGPSTLSWTGVT